MTTGNEHGPIHRNDEYSPVQVKAGVLDPTEEDFPPARERVNQDEPDIHASLAEYEPMRITIQDSDACQLACPGCFVAEWAHKDGDKRAQHDSVIGESAIGVAHIHALGDSLQDVFYLGVEPTLSPDNLSACASAANKVGATVMSITNGASGARRYEETLGRMLDNEDLYKTNISLDSIDPTINNFLRGKTFAHEKTLETISVAIEREDPFKVNITVWPQSYHTVVDTVEALMAKGVKRFGFHAGTTEGMKNKDSGVLQALDPLAWRALCARLIALREQHREQLEDFTLPLIYFTEEELRTGIIGNQEDYEAYRAHLEKVEADESYESPVPIKVCPAMSVPQIYDFALDGKHDAGGASLCNLHTVGADKAGDGDYFAHFNPESAEFEVEQDPEKNELMRMFNSKHLCPARKYDRSDESPSDRFETEQGDLFQACRFVSLNQFPYTERQFGYEHYEVAERFHREWSEMAMAENPDMQWLNQLYASSLTFEEKFMTLKENHAR